VVVSPLIALMDDQVRALKGKGITAVAMHTGKSWDEVSADRERARSAALLYVSPERLKSPRFRRWLATLSPVACAVDEAHCISEWGHDFRPDYLRLGLLKEEFNLPIMACTATATRQVMAEIRQSLGLQSPEVILGGFARPNLSFSVEHVRGDKARLERANQLLNEAGVAVPNGGRGVVYAATRKRARDVAKALKKCGHQADYYHAGRTDGARARAQERFETGQLRVLVATNAFGMGIDVPDIRIVLHIEAPATLESLYQEAGRAGRDGRSAQCALLYSPKDAWTRARLRGESGPPGAEAGCKALMDYVYGTRCRAQEMIAYFSGEAHDACGRCDACLTPAQVAEAVSLERAEAARRARAREQKRQKEHRVRLDASQMDQVIAFVSQLKRPLGKRLVAQGLRGSHAKAVRRKGLKKNPHFGVMRGVPEVAITRAVELLLEDGRLSPKGKKYPTVWIPGKRVRPVRTASSQAGARQTKLPPIERALKNFRKRESRKRRIKAYQVFTNETIRAIAQGKPSNLEQLLSVKGIGPAKLAKYGSQILEIVASSQRND